MTDDTYGYRDGDRVLDLRDGSTGTVVIFDEIDILDADYEPAEIVWDGLSTQSALSLDAPHLAHIPA